MMENKALKAAATVGLGYGAFKFLDDKLNIMSDIRTIKNYAPMLREMRNMPKTQTVADEWEQTCDRVLSSPDPAVSSKAAIIFSETGEAYSFLEVDQIANKIARFFKANVKLAEGSVVAVIIENRPEFVFLTLGLTKAGLIPAFINYNNRAKPMQHSIEISLCKAIVFGSECADNLATAYEAIKHLKVPMFVYDDKSKKVAGEEIDEETERAKEEMLSKSINLDSQICNYLGDRLPRSVRANQKLEGVYGYIYTSGTTGLPKACIVTHSKLLVVPRMWRSLYKVKQEDVLYTAMPMYHSAGGILSLSQLTTGGLTMIISRKFSATRYFKECYEYGATVTQYIGEMARYLLATPPGDFDKKHKVRLIVGNGLRREVWVPFVKRFNIQQVGEFYGSTEGNVAFTTLHDYSNMNVDEIAETTEGVGAVGRVGAIMKTFQRFKIVKHDVASEMPVRSEDGLCIDCDCNEGGELLGWINENNSTTAFHGYTSKEATEKKLLRDVVSKGDLFFRTGDLVRRDSKGWVYFVDRIGDTFRWKGENVSTNEVSEVVSVFPGILEANIYGVKVPGNEDGRACMAAIVFKDLPTDGDLEEAVRQRVQQFDFDAFEKHLKKNLASYARPMFLRFLAEMDSTGTFKQKKVDLVNEGIDINKVKDAMFVLDPQTQKYVPLDQQKFVQISNGQAKL